MHHPSYRRPVAYLGLAAVILVIISLFTAAYFGQDTNFEGEAQALDQTVVTLVLAFAMLPDLLAMLFLLGLTHILIAPERVFVQQILIILTVCTFIFNSLGSLMLSVQVALAGSLADYHLQPIMDGAFQQGHWLYGLVLVGLVLAWEHPKIFPTYMRWLALGAALIQFMLGALFPDSTTTASLPTLLNVFHLMWITLVAAYLLIADKGQWA